MRVPWPRRHLLVTERRFDDLRMITRRLLRAIGLRRRIRRLIVRSSLRKPLDDVLVQAVPPRRVLLVAHGYQGRLVAAREGGVDKYVDFDWWGELDGPIELIAFGCETADFVKVYDLTARCASFVGYREKVRFYTGSALGRQALQSVCSTVAELFLHHPEVGDAFVETLRARYDELITEYGRRSTDFARRLVLIELERQLESVVRSK